MWHNCVTAVAGMVVVTPLCFVSTSLIESVTKSNITLKVKFIELKLHGTLKAIAQALRPESKRKDFSNLKLN